MPTPSEQADELETQIVSDVVNGVSSFGDGTHNVGMMNSKERLDVVDRLRRNEVIANNPARGMRFSRMIPGGCG